MVWKWGRRLLVVLVLSAPAWAAEVVSELTVDGVKYENVRWGPVNAGKVVMFHNRGITTVALEKLPAEYARGLGYRPTEGGDRSTEPPARRAAPVIEPARPAVPRPQPVGPEDRIPPHERVTFERARDSQMMLAGVLADKSSLTELTGFVRSRASVTGGEADLEGWMLELARLKPTDRPIPVDLQMRPGLWESTGEEVFLRHYSTTAESGMLLRIYAKEDEPIRGYRTFVVAEELTYDRWKKLR